MRGAESSHAAAPGRDNDKNSGQRKTQQYKRRCDDGNLRTCLLPSWNAKKQAYKCGNEYDSNNEGEHRNAEEPKRMVVECEHNVVSGV
jgi:hypothetical protein